MLIGSFEMYNKTSSIAPFTFDAVELWTVTINGRHIQQQLIGKKSDDLKCEHQQVYKGIQFKTIVLRGEIQAKIQEIAALQRRYIGHFSNEDKNDDITIIARNNEVAEYPYISPYGQYGCRKAQD